LTDTPTAAQLESRFNEVRIEVGERCAQDSEFRAAVLANPQAALEAEYELPAGTLSELKVKVVEETLGEVLLPIPADMANAELTDEQLEAVAGGFAFTAAVTAGAVAGAATTVAAGGLVQAYTPAGRSW
jgi:acyl-coenzyme A thioesterase PaaI-like protein